MTAISLICSFGIPSFALGLVLRKMDKQEKKRDAQEQVRERHTYLMIRAVTASIALGEATAHAIKDGKCNGEMTEALKHATEVKHETKDFLYEQASKHMQN